MSRPLLSALSSSSIQVSFLSPAVPNGIITSYTLTRSSLTPTPLTITIPLNISALDTSDEYFVYVDGDLRPFTNYVYNLTVCTNGGCTTGDPSSEVTLEDTPAGISAPSIEVITTLESSVLEVAWQEPTEPNGIIQGYLLFGLDLGLYDTGRDAVDCCAEYLLNLTANNSSFSNSCSTVAVVNSTVTTFIDADVQPYSFYQYCIIVSNNIASLASDLSPPTRTAPALMPRVGPNLNATTINSTSIHLSWSSLALTDLLGPLESYTLYGSVSGTESVILFTGLSQSFTATGLIASTEYAFVVSNILQWA